MAGPVTGQSMTGPVTGQRLTGPVNGQGLTGLVTGQVIYRYTIAVSHLPCKEAPGKIRCSRN